MHIAATGTAANVIGAIGAGGMALILWTALILGTREKSEHTLSKKAAIICGVLSGTAAIGAGQLWGLPNDLILGVLTAITGNRAMADVGTGSICVTILVIAYLLPMASRAAGVLGLFLASTLAVAGGAWSQVSGSIGDLFAQFA
ncbi:hypothetical protein ACH4MJ_04255 [Streptomyces anulatus]